MGNTIITGILSYGMSGKVFHAPFVQAHPGFELRAVVERHQKKASEDYPEIISYDSVEDLIADPEIRLVIVNTPNYTHFEYAKMALEAGKDVLVEKPFVPSVAEAEELFQLAKARGCSILPYQNRRFDSDFLSVKEIVEERFLGRLVEVHIRFDRYRNVIGPKFFKETPLPGSGISYDLGPHLLDQVISLFGKPLYSRKTTGVFREGSQVDDYANFHLVYPDQLNVFVTASMLVADPGPGYVLHGTKGSYYKDRTDVQEEQLLGGMKPTDHEYGKEQPGRAGRLTLMESGERHRHEKEQKQGDYKQLFEAVYRTLVHGEAFPVKPEEILWQLQILESGISK